jgi:2-phospho-L-lactate guanylyltransferase (CobY/MobA/RfbA family)
MGRLHIAKKRRYKMNIGIGSNKETVLNMLKDKQTALNNKLKRIKVISFETAVEWEDISTALMRYEQQIKMIETGSISLRKINKLSEFDDDILQMFNWYF